MDVSERLLGSWELTLWTITEAGVVRHPFGDWPTGSLIYAYPGRMSAIVSAGDRPVLSTGTPRRAPVDELAGAFLSFFCYAGRWYVDGDSVVHVVDLALNPAMVGTSQRRRIELVGDVLSLTADEPVGDGLRQHRLGWRRVGPPVT